MDKYFFVNSFQDAAGAVVYYHSRESWSSVRARKKTEKEY